MIPVSSQVYRANDIDLNAALHDSTIVTLGCTSTRIEDRCTISFDRSNMGRASASRPACISISALMSLKMNSWSLEPVYAEAMVWRQGQWWTPGTRHAGIKSAKANRAFVHSATGSLQLIVLKEILRMLALDHYRRDVQGRPMCPSSVFRV